MIDYNKLDRLMNLPVSEEMLGAYIEGNLYGSELREVHNIIEQNPELEDIILNTENIVQINNDLPNIRYDYSGDNYDNDLSFPLLDADEFILPEIVTDLPFENETTIVELTQINEGHENDSTGLGFDDIATSPGEWCE